MFGSAWQRPGARFSLAVLAGALSFGFLLPAAADADGRGYRGLGNHHGVSRHAGGRIGRAPVFAPRRSLSWSAGFRPVFNVVSPAGSASLRFGVGDPYGAYRTSYRESYSLSFGSSRSYPTYGYSAYGYPHAYGAYSYSYGDGFSHRHRGYYPDGGFAFRPHASSRAYRPHAYVLQSGSAAAYRGRPDLPWRARMEAAYEGAREARSQRSAEPAASPIRRSAEPGAPARRSPEAAPARSSSPPEPASGDEPQHRRPSPQPRRRALTPVRSEVTDTGTEGVERPTGRSSETSETGPSLQKRGFLYYPDTGEVVSGARSRARAEEAAAATGEASIASGQRR